MKKGLLFLYSFAFSFILFSQNEGITGARSYGIAGSSITLSDVWSSQNNPAGLGNLTNWQAGISYENQFLQSELSNRSVGAVIPVSAGSFGVTLNQFGYTAYKENRIGIAYGQALSKTFSMGIQLNYSSVSISNNYGSTGAVSANIGLLAKLNDELSLAAVVINPNRAELAELTEEKFPTIIKLGLSYDFSEKVKVVSEVAKDIDFDSNVKFGIEYKAIDILYLRAGYATSPSLSTFGFGVNLNNFNLDFASGFDSNLGFSPQISLIYNPNKKFKDESNN